MKVEIIKILVAIFILPMCMCHCVGYDKQKESDKMNPLQLVFNSRISKDGLSSPVFADSFFTIPEYREIRYSYRARGDYKLPYRIYKDASFYYIYTDYYYSPKGNETDDKIRKYSIQISENKVKSILRNFRKFRFLGEYQNSEQYFHLDDPRGRTKGYFDYLILTFSSKKGPYPRYWVYTDGNNYYINFEKMLLYTSPNSIKKSSIAIPAEKARIAIMKANFQSRLVYQTAQINVDKLSPPFYSADDYKILFHHLFPNLSIDTPFKVYFNYGEWLNFETKDRGSFFAKKYNNGIQMWEADTVLEK